MKNLKEFFLYLTIFAAFGTWLTKIVINSDANPQGVKQVKNIKIKNMSKVKIKTENGIEFIEKNGILKAKPITSEKEGKNKGKAFISIDYGNNCQIVVGPFASELEAENIIINDL